MMILKLTNHDNGDPFYFNFDNVIAFYRMDDDSYTHISFTRSKSYAEVEETPEEILKMMEDKA